ASENSEQGVPSGANQQTPLITDGRQQHKTGNEWACCSARRGEQCRNSSAIHPAFCTRSNKRDDGREQNPRHERSREHQRHTQDGDLPPRSEAKSTAKCPHHLARKK